MVGGAEFVSLQHAERRRIDVNGDESVLRKIIAKRLAT